MSLPPALQTPILETILIRLTALFLIGANGDPTAARNAAAQMLAAYHPKTDDELRLAANIVLFSFQALEALSQAAAPDLPLTRIIRLRGSAVTLSRESAKAERRLAELRNPTQHPAKPQPQPAEPNPKTERAAALIEDTRKVAAAAKANNQTWTQSYDARQRDARIAASLLRAEAKVAAAAQRTAPPQAQPTHQTQPTA